MQALDLSRPTRFKNVLLATDFSPSASSAMLYSLALARRWKARIYLAHVVNSTTIFGHEAVRRAVNDAWRQANTEITNQLIAGRLEGLQHQVVVRQGEVWDELQHMIVEFGIDLLVTGTRGRSGVWKMLLGSTAEKIFRNSPVPVLTVGPNAPAEIGPEGPTRILYSTGFAAQSLYAGTFALSLAEQYQAHLAMLHVITTTSDEPDQARLQEEAKLKLQALVPAGMDMAAQPELFVAFGDVAERILNLAQQWQPGLIVLGVRQYGKEAGRNVWATAYNVVANAPCPVLTVRSPEGMG